MTVLFISFMQNLDVLKSVNMLTLTNAVSGCLFKRNLRQRHVDSLLLVIDRVHFTSTRIHLLGKMQCYTCCHIRVKKETIYHCRR